MNDETTARMLLTEQQARYPACETEDLIKALYQAAFGCGHFVENEEKARAWLHAEMTDAKDGAAPLLEAIGDRYARVHLGAYRLCGAQEDTLARLFVLTSHEEPDEARKALFQAGLEEMIRLSGTGALALDVNVVRERVASYRAQGCPALHHSRRFNAQYRPMYRVVRRDWAQLLPLFARIDTLRREKGRVLVAIDGMCASGKTTLSQLLEAVYGTQALHMDDFFLQPHQRTPERFAQPGGNVDYERFSQEVLTPLRAGEAFDYRVYDCTTQTILPGERRGCGEVAIVEGAYSLHPALAEAYDLRVMLKINAQAQRERIRRRNGEEMLARFVNEWIPLENRYLDATHLEARCDMIWRAQPGDALTAFVQEG